MSESKSAKPRYKTTNWAAYNAALKARGSLPSWLNKDMRWYALASDCRGRQRVFSDAAIQFCLSFLTAVHRSGAATTEEAGWRPRCIA